MEIRKYSRKNFVSKVGKSTFYTTLASVLPIKLLSSKNFIRNRVDIHIHPSAVKRNNKV